MNEQVGFIGLGAMGSAMAANLIAAGIVPTVWNRTASKAQPLTSRGAKLAGSPGETAEPGGIVITMLADDAAVESVVTEGSVAARLGAGGIHVSMSTIAPATARKLARYHADRGNTYVAAPVFGRPENAAQRQLVICAAGPSDAKQRLRPIFDAIGRAVFDFGEEPSAANVAKLCGNFMIAAAIEAMGEAFAMAEKSGVDRVRVAEMLGQTLFACPVYKNYGQMVAAKRHVPAGFRMPLGLKDIELVLRTAGEALAPMPVAGILRERLLSGLAKGREEMDWSALALGALDEAGVK